MIIEFGVRNFRSIKEWQYLTLETQDKDYKIRPSVRPSGF